MNEADNTFLINVKGFDFHSLQLCTHKQTDYKYENA